MKKRNVIFLGGMLFFYSAAFSQVGINSETPQATLDVAAIKTDGTTAEGIIAPRLTRSQIINADSKYGTAQTGALVYATDASGTATTKTANITAAGYYYFDGSVWQASKTPAAAATEPWYLQNSTTQATANTQNIYQNGNIGIGNFATTTPQATLDVKAIKTDGTTAEGIIAPRLTRSQIINADSKYGTAQTGAMVYATDVSGTATTKTANITAAGYYYFDGSVWQASKTPAAAATEPWYLQNSTTQATANTQNIYQNGNIGIGNFATTTPQATLDVKAINTNGTTAEGIIAPRLTRSQIIAADSKYTAAQTGAMVYATDASGTATTKTANITAAGYYYFDGSVWQASKNAVPAATEPWYLQNSTTQATANTQNIYQNGNIGIGNFATTTPQATLDVKAIKTDGTTAEGIIAPRLTRSQIINADSKYTAAQTGAMVYATDASGTATTKTANITAAGYYYFDGSVWQASKTPAAASTEPWYLQNSTTQATANTQNIYQNGKIGIGDFSGTAVTSGLDILNNNSGDIMAGRIIVRTYSSNPYNSGIEFRNTRGTLASPAPLVNGDIIGYISFSPIVNAQMGGGASITSRYVGDGSSSDTDLIFSTKGTTAILINKDHQVSIAGTADLKSSPARATLDVRARYLDGSLPEGFLAPRLTRAQLILGDAQYASAQTGDILYVTDASGTATTKTANITAAGYYYFDGSVWQAFKASPEPWYQQNSTTQATANTQNIYQNGNIGIGNYSASSVGSKLEVDGAATNKTAYNASTGTTIDFSKSNLAYSTSTAAAPAFALNNIKDGGTYTLAWQGSRAGTPTFTAPSGITTVIAGGAATTAKLSTGDIVYTIVVIGTKAYIYTTQF